MKINIKNLSVFLVIFNALIMFKDLPLALISYVFVVIFFSFIINIAWARTFFKVVFLFCGLALLRILFKTFLVTEAGVSLVMILSALKLWELDTENDHFNMFLILALLECCLFLLNPTFLAFFFGLIKIIIFFYFILKIRNYDLSLLSTKRLLILIAPSLLLSLILFYTFPRFTQGFVNATNNKLLFSGASSVISFKNLGPPNLSTKIVFKVTGLNPNLFPIPMIYWRQNVLWDYHKDEWHSSYFNLRSEPMKLSNPSTSYRIYLVENYNEFLPVLDGISKIEQSSFPNNYYSENTYRLKNIARTAVDYDVTTSYKEKATFFSPTLLRKGLRLRSSQKEKVKNLILKDQASSNLLSDEKLFQLVITFFKNQNYRYSLNPPIYNSVEDFISNGKSGYCSHFASAFAFMSRSVGLPARIVSGFQGGEFNPFDKSLTIRELDGHVWVEVYLEKTGWLRFDPTAIIAPDRIELGANMFNEKISPYFDLYFFKLPKESLRFPLINKFSFWIDSLGNQYNTNILNFDKDKQQQILNAFFPKSISLGWLFVLALSGSMPLFWFLFVWQSKMKINLNELKYQKFIMKMKKEGIQKLPFETATVFRDKCLSLAPEHALEIQLETDQYIKYFYENP
jgi:transglutaminase-like putative cysteine protease